MRFSVSAVLALATTVHNSDAFLSPAYKMRTTEMHMDKGFMDALNPSSKGDGDEVNENGEGSSRFKEMMELAKQQQSAKPVAHAIENPFLNPASSNLPPTQPSADPDQLSVEEQARMFREMMAGNQSPAVPPPPPIRTAKEDRAGRPIGRNADADKIANTSDLYFAQLKRDSTVRTLGRIRGDDDVSEAVFEDDGIKQLDDLLKKNPYLKG